MSEQKLYWPGGRDYDVCGDQFAKHMNAMTAEGLHGKAEIAWELAHRDAQIDALTAKHTHALAVERGKLEAADAENDRLVARVAELACAVVDGRNELMMYANGGMLDLTAAEKVAMADRNNELQALTLPYLMKFIEGTDAQRAALADAAKQT